jgi:hypothetical protein
VARAEYCERTRTQCHLHSRLKSQGTSQGHDEGRLAAGAVEEGRRHAADDEHHAAARAGATIVMPTGAAAIAAVVRVAGVDGTGVRGVDGGRAAGDDVLERGRAAAAAAALAVDATPSGAVGVGAIISITSGPTKVRAARAPTAFASAAATVAVAAGAAAAAAAGAAVAAGTDRAVVGAAAATSCTVVVPPGCAATAAARADEDAGGVGAVSARVQRCDASTARAHLRRKRRRSRFVYMAGGPSACVPFSRMRVSSSSGSSKKCASRLIETCSSSTAWTIRGNAVSGTCSTSNSASEVKAVVAVSSVPSST